jgi:hypothetical protein
MVERGDCGWCGRAVKSPSVSSYKAGYISWGDGENEVELVTEFSCDFCCNGCAWAFAVESHRLYGQTGKELRAHLINEHGLVHPPGKPGGPMSRECRERFNAEAKAIVKAFGLISA